MCRGRGFVEQLEDRRPLAITPVFAAGVLTFTGDGADDTLVITSNNATSSDVDFSGTGIVGTVNQAGVTAIVIDLDGGSDSVVLNGSAAADTIALNGLAISYGGTPYTLTAVEDLAIDGQGDADTISATGVTVPGVLSLSGGTGTDALSIAGPLSTGSLTVSDITTDDVELAGVITTAGNQQYSVPVTLTANTTIDAGAGNITFTSTVSGAAFTLDANSTGATTFGGAVNVAALTTNVGGTTAINGDLVTTSGNQNYNDPVTLNSAVNLTTLTSATGGVRFGDTLDSFQLDEELLTINAAADIEFIGSIGSAAAGALSSLDANANGNVRIAAARIINTADLEATTGQLIDLNGGATNITANSMIASAANGINIDTAVNNLLASNTTTGDIDITEVDDVTVLLLSAPGQTVTLTVGGAVLDGNLALNNITATSLVVASVNGVSLDTTVANILANNTTAGGIDISEFDDLNVSMISAAGQTVTLAAGGAILDGNAAANNITANSLIATAVTGISLDTTIANLVANNSTSGGIDINDADDLNATTVSAAGQTVTLTAGGAILDVNGAATNVTATSLIASAVTGISLDTAIANLVANSSTSGGIDISDVDDLNVSTVVASGQTVTLTAGGALTDGNAAATNVTATSLVASAVTGINLDTTIDNLTATNTTSGGIDISDSDSLNVLTVSAPGQTVTLSAGGAITDGNAAANNVTAAALIASAVTGISLDTTIADLTVSSTTSGNVDINEVDDLNVLTISAPGQTVTLAAGGAITDGNAAANNVTAASLIATAVTGISLDTTIGSISASNTTSGGIDISETDDLSVLGISAPGQTVTLAAGGAITDGNGPASNVIATSLNVSAVNGITLGTTVDNLTASNTTAGGIAIGETDDLNILNVSAPGQTASITAAGDLNVNTVTAGSAILVAGDIIADVNGGAVNITATSLDATAANGISLDTTIANLTALNSVSGGIDISETDNLNVLTIAAAGQTVTLAAGGAITDGNAAAVNVTAASLVVSAATGISLDTTIANLLASNSTSGGVDINETDNLNVSTVLAAGQTVTLSAGGALLDGNAAANNVTADSLVATAVTGISLDTTIANLTASNTTSGGIDINELDSMAVNTTSAPGQTVTLAAGGAITDGNAAANNVTATALVVSAVNGISLDTTIADLTASNTTSGGVDISDADSLNVLTVSAPAQAVTLAAGGALTDGNAGAVNVTANSLTANAVTGINLDTTIADLSATNTTSGGIDINETDNLNVLLASAPGQTVNLQAGGNLNVTTVNAGTATLIATGAITDANGSTVNVTGGSLNALANNGIALGTAIDNFTATNNASGDILINESNGLNVLSAINAAAAIQIVCASGLLNITNVDAKGHFLGSTDDSAAPGDNLVVSGNVEADNAVSLVAGDDITLQGASNVKSINSFLYLKVGGTVDSVGGQLVMFGAAQGNAALQYPIVAEGGSGNDLFSIQNLPSSPMAILARGGALDNTFITFSNAADKINAFATLVDVVESGGVAKPGIEITYVDNEQLFFNSAGGDDKVFIQMPEPIQGVLANIIRMSTGAGDDSLKINGSTQNDVIRVADFTSDANYRFQVDGTTGETECLQVFGFTGNDIIENSASIASLLDGGNGQDHITGSNLSVQPATAQAVYDVIFGGGDADSLFGRAGNDFLYADFDYNLGAPVQTFANGDLLNGGRGTDVLIALGGDSVTRDAGDFEPDIIVGQNVSLSINDFLFAQLLAPSSANINQQLQAGLAKKCAMPIP